MACGAARAIQRTRLASTAWVSGPAAGLRRQRQVLGAGCGQHQGGGWHCMWWAARAGEQPTAQTLRITVRLAELKTSTALLPCRQQAHTHNRSRAAPKVQSLFGWGSSAVEEEADYYGKGGHPNTTAQGYPAYPLQHPVLLCLFTKQRRVHHPRRHSAATGCATCQITRR